MSGRARSSVASRLATYVAVLACFGAAIGACADDKFQDGEACFKDQDCVSGFCLAQACAARMSPLGDSGLSSGTVEAGPEAGEARDGAPDAGEAADASDASPAGDAACEACP